jgi:hypothetical protein
MKTKDPYRQGLPAALGAWAFTLGGISACLAAPLMPVTRADLCVTEGAVEAQPGPRLSVDAAKMRAYVNLRTPPSVDARFTYLGPTSEEARLGSGELRRQFGLKLRAQDACNLVYVMWRIEPESKLVVSIKSNPGQHSSSECGNRGYRNIKPRRAAPIAELKAGQTHTLAAAMSGEEMKVFVDGAPVWEGSLGAEITRLEGPVGIRSDNARLLIELRAGEPVGTAGGTPASTAAGTAGRTAAACRSGAEEAE